MYFGLCYNIFFKIKYVVFCVIINFGIIIFLDFVYIDFILFKIFVLVCFYFIFLDIFIGLCICEGVLLGLINF